MNYEHPNLTPCGLTPLTDKRLAHPEDVVCDKQLSKDEKRALLAGWASDAHAVPGAPTLRQLDNGAVVTLGAILNALKEVDDPDGNKATSPASGYRAGHRRLEILSKWRKRSPVRRRRDDDDNDPPPVPAAVRPRRRMRIPTKPATLSERKPASVPI